MLPREMLALLLGTKPRSSYSMLRPI